MLCREDFGKIRSKTHLRTMFNLQKRTPPPENFQSTCLKLKVQDAGWKKFVFRIRFQGLGFGGDIVCRGTIRLQNSSSGEPHAEFAREGIRLRSRMCFFFGGNSSIGNSSSECVFASLGEKIL